MYKVLFSRNYTFFNHAFKIKIPKSYLSTQYKAKILSTPTYRSPAHIFGRRKHLCQNLNIRTFKTTPSLHVHPVLVTLLRPIGRLLTIIISRIIKLLWKKLPEDKKILFWNHFRKYRYIYSGFGFYTTGVLLILFEKHLTYCPITTKTRFKLFDDEKVKDHDRLIFQNECKSTVSQQLSTCSPEVLRVVRVGYKLLENNPVLKNWDWKAMVIDDRDTMNAYALSHGQIVLYSGLFDVCSSDTELANVIAHEMAHVVLQHGNTKISRYFLTELLLWPVLFLTWLTAPSDFFSILLTQFYGQSADLSFILPYGRDMELEADFLGLIFMSNACYDVRKSPELWKTIHEVDELKKNHKEGSGAGEPLLETTLASWYNTHPDPLTRSEQLDKCLEKAIKLRTACGCPSLDAAPLMQQQNWTWQMLDFLVNIFKPDKTVRTDE